MTSRAAAARYARALFDVVRVEGSVEQALGEIGQFADLVSTNDQLAGVFANPAIPAARKRAVVEALLARADGMSAPVRKLILLLADRDRLVLLPEVAAAYRDRLMQHQNIVRGEVTTAVALSADDVASLERSLATATGRRVVLTARVDPGIIGGAVTRLGSTVYDGSVTTQLQKLKEALVEAGQ
jgi:F-type H+-transporting ATPase subunit delta